MMGACDFCAAKRFDVAADANALGIALLGGEGHHFSLGTLIDEGYQVITY
jgi:hypothetical protein